MKSSTVGSGMNSNRLLNLMQEAKLLAEQHRIDYDTYRPQSTLRGRTSLEGHH